MSAIATGNQVTAQFGIESTFGTEATTKTLVFGIQQKLSGVTLSESIKPLSEFGLITRTKFAGGLEKISYGAEWVYSSARFWELLLGKAPVVSGTTSTYTPVPTPKTFTQVLSVESPTVHRKFLGCILNSVNFRFALDDLVMCSGEVQSGKEAAITTSGASVNQATDDVDFPFTFEHAEIKIGSSVIADVQSADLSVQPNHKLVWGMGSPTATNVYKEVLEMTGKLGLIFKGGTNLAYVKGRAEQASLTLTISNGQAAAAKKEHVITLTGISFGEVSNPAIEPNALIMEDLAFVAREIEVVYTKPT